MDHEYSSIHYVFPFHLFKKDSKILILGNEVIGQSFFHQANCYGHVDPVGLICLSTDEDLSERSAKEVEKYQFDAILLAVEDIREARRIGQWLFNMEIDPSCIKWDGNSYRRDGFLRWVYLPLLNTVQKFSPFPSEPRKELKKIAFLEDRKSLSLHFGNTVTDIIIPIYNAFELLQECIESVYKNTEIPYCLYLVNDNSPDARIHDYLLELKDGRRPFNLKELHIYENEENIGFIRSVNNMLSLSKNNVVLLNSDTEVPKKWLRRLILPMFQEKKIATVIPTTNSASLASFPDFGKDNDLGGYTLSELDSAFSYVAGNKFLELHTGVGFCMAMNRKCIDEIGVFDPIYGKGYCEETDWCQRAVSYGYKNLWAMGVFVYHKHGASFSERRDESISNRKKQNRKILLERYPDLIKAEKKFHNKEEWDTVFKSVYRHLETNYLAMNPKMMRNILVYGDLGSIKRLFIEKRNIEKFYYDNIVGICCTDIENGSFETQKKVNEDEIPFLSFDKIVLASNRAGELRKKIKESNIIPMEKVFESVNAYLEDLRVKNAYKKLYGSHMNPKRHKIKKGKKVIYTAIIGNYDSLQEPRCIQPNVDYICFTNNQDMLNNTSTIWKMVYVEDTSLSNVLLARKIKMFPHLYLSEYDLSIWIDGKYQIEGNLVEYCETYFLEKDMLCFPHYERDNVLEEAGACIFMKRGNKEEIWGQIMDYWNHGYSMDTGLYETACIARYHNMTGVIALMEAWWEQLCEHSSRDQISLPYVCWKLSYRPDICDANIKSNRWIRLSDEYRSNKGKHLGNVSCV